MYSKREEIITELKKKAEENPLVLTFSSPKVKTVQYFFIKEAATDPDNENMGNVSLNAAPVSSQHVPEEFSAPQEASNEVLLEDSFDEMLIEQPVDESYVVSSPEDSPLDDFYDDEPLTYKEEKKRLKDKRKEEKAFEKIKKDAHKRGYDTGLLYQLDDPEDLYDFSDEEIEQIQVAGIVNEDGFYSFVYPADLDSIKKEKISKQRILVVSGLVLVALLLFGILMKNLFDLF